MTEFSTVKGDSRFVCNIDIKSKEAVCRLERKWGDYGFKQVASQTYDISKILAGENKLPALGKAEGERDRDILELHDFASWFVPQFIKIEKSRDLK